MILPNRPITTNFTTGQISDRLRGRVDLEQYNNGAAQLSNFLVMPGGGTTRRPGSAFVGFANPISTQTHLLPFVVANITSYLLELGPQYMRFWRNRAAVVDVNGIPLQLPTPYAAADLRLIRYAQSADVLYLTHSLYPPQKVSRTSANTFTIEPVLFANGPYDTENTGDVGGPGGAPAATQPEPPVIYTPFGPIDYPNPSAGNGG